MSTFSYNWVIGVISGREMGKNINLWYNRVNVKLFVENEKNILIYDIMEEIHVQKDQKTRGHIVNRDNYLARFQKLRC